MSHNLWPRYGRHFVGIARHNALSKMAKIYRVIQTKLNQLVWENVYWSLTCQQSVGLFKRYYSSKHFTEFYLQDGGKNQLA